MQTTVGLASWAATKESTSAGKSECPQTLRGVSSLRVRSERAPFHKPQDNWVDVGVSFQPKKNVEINVKMNAVKSGHMGSVSIGAMVVERGLPSLAIHLVLGRQPIRSTVGAWESKRSWC